MIVSTLVNRKAIAPQGITPGDLPEKRADFKYPVKPKDSASLIVLRRTGSKLQVLMGKRGKKAVFSNVYVFAGGKVEKEDYLPHPATFLKEDLPYRISSKPEKSLSFAMAAVRETYEETGLLLGATGDLGPTNNTSWNEIRALNLAPDLAKLEYVGHAITPASKAVRFNAKFFYAWENDMSGKLAGSGELIDLGFLNIKDALKLPLVDVTQFMLEEIMHRDSKGFETPKTYPFFGYRKNRRYQRYL